MNAQMALERFELLAVFKANKVVGMNRLLHGHCGYQWFRGSFVLTNRQSGKRLVNTVNQVWQVPHRNWVVGYIG